MKEQLKERKVLIGLIGEDAGFEQVVLSKALIFYIIGFCGIKKEEGIEIGHSLKANKSLVSLDIRNILIFYIDENNIGVEGGKAIAEALKVNTTLQTLNIGNILIFYI